MSTSWPLALAGALVAAGCLSASAWPCGLGTDCVLGDRTYRIALPSERDETRRLGAIIFAHGYRGSAEGTMRHTGLLDLAAELDMALVAANADRPDWQLPGAPSFPEADGAAPIAYIDTLRRALVDRHGIDPQRIVVSRFSAGGMLVWHLACHRGHDYAGFVAFSGTFWSPLPDSCPTTAVDLIHYHGTTDQVVPLDGRPIGQGRQGDVQEALALLRTLGGYHPATSGSESGLACELALNDAGNRLELCLFDGGHGFEPAHLARAMRLFGLLPEQ
jgi:polyhydroxybutyrate depolymerase